MQIERKSIREQVLEIIKKSILDHTYPMGSRINLDELRRNLGVSNTPLREAISILEGEGLVEYRTNAGVFVVSPSREEHFRLAQYMLFLMLSAYDYCVDMGSTALLCSKMQMELDKQKTCVEQGDTYHYALCSNSFDKCVIDETGNPYLQKSYGQNYTLLTLMNAEYAANDRQSMELFFHQHEQILDAIRQEDHALVHLLLKQHYYKKNWIPEGFVLPV